MNISEKYSTIKLSTAIDLFLPIFILYHNWNIDDNYDNVKQSKRKYIFSTLINHKKLLDGKIYYINNDDFDCEDDDIIDLENTIFDINKTINLIVEIVASNKSSLTYELIKTKADRNAIDSYISDNSNNNNKDHGEDKAVIERHIKAAIAATIYCVDNTSDISITKDDLHNELKSQRFDHVDSDLIRRLIPEHLRHPDKGGPPSKLLDKAIEAAFRAGMWCAKDPNITMQNLTKKIDENLGKLSRQDITSKIYKLIEEHRAV